MSPENAEKLKISIMTPKEKDQKSPRSTKRKSVLKSSVKQTHVIPDVAAFQKTESISTIDYQIQQ
jgi:hypothetical protein